jgi:hypothetical protein
MTCSECRERMCTDGVLNRVRCANCRQVKFEQFYDLTFALVFLASAQFISWLISNRSKD